MEGYGTAPKNESQDEDEGESHEVQGRASEEFAGMGAQGLFPKGVGSTG